jgi:hypothetical protein
VVDRPAGGTDSIDRTAPAPRVASGREVVLSEALPPADTALAPIFEELLDRARRGDARAACRLAADLQRCSRYAKPSREEFDSSFRSWEQDLAEEDNELERDRIIDRIASQEEYIARMDALCGGLRPDQRQLAFPLQMQAAQARPELRTWAALSPALDRAFFVDDLERWQQYRQVALPWLEAAAAEGDLVAVVALTRVVGYEFFPFEALDDARFITYTTLLQRYGMGHLLENSWVQRALQHARARLTPQGIADAERRASDLFRPERMPVSQRDMEAARWTGLVPMSMVPDCGK